MSTLQLMQAAGAPTLLLTLLLVLAVAILRLIALPLVITVLALDHVAALLSEPLALTTTTTEESAR